MNSVRPKKIEAFEDVDLKLTGLITIVGISETGKTILLRSIINKLYAKGLHTVYVFSATADIYRDTDYNFTKGSHVRKIDMNAINRLKTLQEIIVNKSVKDKRITPKWIAIVLDDFIGDPNSNLSAKAAGIISSLAVSGRHYKICTIVLTQHLNKCPPVIRLQSKYMFVTKTSMSTIRDGVFPLQTQYTNKSQFWELYSSHTQSAMYTSMMLQSVNPYDENIRWLHPAKPVTFVDDPESAEIIREVELDKLENEETDNGDTANDESSLSDDSSGLG